MLRFQFRAMVFAASIAVISLTACGAPDDLPATAGLGPGQALPTLTALAPTLIPLETPSASSVESATPSASSSPSASPSVSATPSASSSPTTELIATPSASPSTSPDPSPSATISPVVDTAVTASAEPEVAHPIAIRIAEEFGVPVSEVEAYHAQGIGYGILAQFYSIANARCGTSAGYTVEQLVTLKQGGSGMGEIRKQALGTAAANECSLGKLKQSEVEAADAQLDAVAQQAKEQQEKERQAKERQAKEQQEKERRAKEQQAKAKKEQAQREQHGKQAQQSNPPAQQHGDHGKGGGKGK